MAFSSSEKTDIVCYLGWPGKVLQATSQVFNSVVDDRLKTVPADTEARTRKFLKRLKAMDDRLDCAADRLAASKVDDITLNAEEIRMLRSERKRYIREMSDLLDIAIMSSSGVNVGVAI